ncbi:hypothetical protein BD779DRAFT_1469152 [Infundibulicybe gibba]|nr:hypothetical protein BD779DRAFT_1469152 [Infundibulicybe gibba]
MADTAPVTAQYGGPLRKPANSGHAIRETPCRGELHVAFCPSLAPHPGAWCVLRSGGPHQDPPTPSGLHIQPSIRGNVLAFIVKQGGVEWRDLDQGGWLEWED